MNNKSEVAYVWGISFVLDFTARCLRVISYHKCKCPQARPTSIYSYIVIFVVKYRLNSAYWKQFHYPLIEINNNDNNFVRNVW